MSNFVELSKPYHKLLEERILEHRYRYYVLDHPVLTDFEYDWFEKFYITECIKVGAENILIHSGVGYSDSHPEYIAAADRVKNNTDYYSLREIEMKHIWDKLGRPKYMKDV